MYKGKRYNFIVACLILVISLVVGTSMGMAFSASNSDTPNLDNLETDPVFEEVDSNQTFNGLKQPSSNASAQSRLAYALAVMNYGKGYTSESIYDIDMLGNNQYFFIKRYRDQEYDLVEEWYKMTGLLSNLGLHYFSGALKTPEGVKKAVVTNPQYYSFDNKNYDSSKGSITDMTPSQYTESKYGVPINNFFAPINPVDSPVLFDNKGRGTNYYEIKVKLNGEKLKPQFFSAFDNRGPITIDVEYINATFKIDKKTGFLMSYEVDAAFNATAYGLKGIAYFSIKEQYLTMNKSALDKIKPIASQQYGVTI